MKILFKYYANCYDRDVDPRPEEWALVGRDKAKHGGPPQARPAVTSNTRSCQKRLRRTKRVARAGPSRTAVSPGATGAPAPPARRGLGAIAATGRRGGAGQSAPSKRGLALCVEVTHTAAETVRQPAALTARERRGTDGCWRGGTDGLCATGY